MKKHEYLPHTADIRVKVESDSLEGLFHASLEAINEVIKKKHRKKNNTKEITRRIEVNASDVTVLLIDFLSEVLTETHTEKVLFPKLEILRLTDHSIAAKISGFPVDYFDEDIKAVTYHEAEVIKNEKGNWETIIIFDI